MKTLQLQINFGDIVFGDIFGDIAFQERESIEDLLEDNLLSDGWHLILRYFITEVEVPFLKITT